MLPGQLAWIREEGHRLDGAVRHRLFGLYRPPGWLPCWFHGLWFFLVARFARLDLIIGTEGDCAHLHETLKRTRSRMNHHLPELGLTCARVGAGALREVCCCHGVTRIWPDGQVRTLLDAAVPGAGAREAVSRYTGAGVTIAVMDTGIYQHPDLAGRIVGFRDFVKNRTAPYDDNGHGTHVAGCAAGSGASSGGRYRGPAPGALLVGVKVLDKTGNGQISSLLAGIDWVIANRERLGIRVLNLSLGAPARGSCAADPLCRAVEAAWEAGITVVAAAGNEGPGAGTVASPGMSARVLTVGASDDRGTPERGDDQIAGFSSRGPTPEGLHKPDLLAPGAAITSLRSPNSYIDKSSRQARVGDHYLTLSGTSMATPILAGIVALLLEAVPSMSPDQVKARLTATAEDRGLARDEQGAGLVDADRALFGPF
ncbi:MAG TPA: S8 family peptidase [Symbiobacteriaceae bacterium]|nr:S8 family peptidase [Symbiobacteriaceae bacterium]